MAQTAAHIRATGKYERGNYDKVLLRIRKDGSPTREEITGAAKNQGKSLNQFIMDAVKKEMEKI